MKIDLIYLLLRAGIVSFQGSYIREHRNGPHIELNIITTFLKMKFHSYDNKKPLYKTSIFRVTFNYTDIPPCKIKSNVVCKLFRNRILCFSTFSIHATHL